MRNMSIIEIILDFYCKMKLELRRLQMAIDKDTMTKNRKKTIKKVMAYQEWSKTFFCKE